MRLLQLLVVLSICSCNDQSDTHAHGQDTIAKTLNKSDIINDSTRLPNDSANTGVQH